MADVRIDRPKGISLDELRIFIKTIRDLNGDVPIKIDYIDSYGNTIRGITYDSKTNRITLYNY